MEVERTPVLVVSGFLGSGKTTLVRRLLQRALSEGRRMAVVSNEFGELGIDRALLGEGEEAYVELAGGCVCCKLSDELRDTLQVLRERARPHRVVIETSGVASPFDTQLNLWRPPVSEWAGEDMAVVVVNAEQVAEGHELEGTFEQQVGCADLLLLNKADLVTTEALAAAELLLARMSPDTPIVRCVHCDVPPELLFPAGPRAGPRPRRRALGARHDHQRFEATEIAVAPGTREDALVERLKALGALRAKGFVLCDSGLRLVQGVGRRVELLEAASAPQELVGRVLLVRRSGG